MTRFQLGMAGFLLAMTFIVAKIWNHVNTVLAPFGG